MTARLRRWTRRRQSNHIPHRMAAIRRHRSENLGAIQIDLLGKGRFRKMVAVALFLILKPPSGGKSKTRR